MLEFKVTEQPDAIEEFFVKEFEKTVKHPMTEWDAEMFAKLILSKHSKFEITEEEKPFFYKMIESRVKSFHDYELDDRTILFLTFICRTAFVAVVYCWCLQYESKKRNLKQITLEDFAEIFPNGFPSESDLVAVWLKQKVKRRSGFSDSDNLLDYYSAGLSLFSEKQD